MNRGDRPIPHWLRPQWEKKKRETALRIADAVEKLTSERRPVTFSSIREAVKILYGLSLSTNTIRRNELAYEIYRQHSRQPRAQMAEPHLYCPYTRRPMWTTEQLCMRKLLDSAENPKTV